MVAVGSIDRRKRLSQFSSRGRQVDVVAPGDEITSCYPPRGYAALSGTSMATPFVSGVVALALSKHKQMGGKTPLRTQQDLIEHLRRTSMDAGPAGFDPLYGYGILNPEKLIQGVKS
jgi:subtilisin family serine protease